MKKTLYLYVNLMLFAVVAIFPTIATASEGYFELKSTNSAPIRCSVFSALLDDRKFHLLTTCRDISFPDGAEVITYYAWGTPVNGGNPIKFGTIGTGKAEFIAEDSFINIYVTQETLPEKQVKSPQGRIVMQGGLQRLRFLDGSLNSGNLVENELGDPVPQENIEEAKSTNQKSRFSRLLAASSIFAFAGLFILIFFLFVVTRR